MLAPLYHLCLTPVLGNLQQIAVTAIQKRLQSFFASCRIPFRGGRGSQDEARPTMTTTHHISCKPILLPLVLRASHHASCKPSCFTPLILRASHHTSCKPACLTPHVLRASHHMPCKVSIGSQSQFWISCHMARCPRNGALRDHLPTPSYRPLPKPLF